MSPSNQYWGQRRLMYLLPYFFEIQILYSLGRDIYGTQIIKNTYLAHKSMCWYHFLAAVGWPVQLQTKATAKTFHCAEH